MLRMSMARCQPGLNSRRPSDSSCGTDLELLDPVEGLLHLRAGANDADEVVHRLLEISVQGIGVLPGRVYPAVP